VQQFLASVSTNFRSGHTPIRSLRYVRSVRRTLPANSLTSGDFPIKPQTPPFGFSQFALISGPFAVAVKFFCPKKLRTIAHGCGWLRALADAIGLLLCFSLLSSKPGIYCRRVTSLPSSFKGNGSTSLMWQETSITMLGIQNQMPPDPMRTTWLSRLHPNSVAWHWPLMVPTAHASMDNPFLKGVTRSFQSHPGHVDALDSRPHFQGIQSISKQEFSLHLFASMFLPQLRIRYGSGTDQKMYTKVQESSCSMSDTPPQPSSSPHSLRQV